MNEYNLGEKKWNCLNLNDLSKGYAGMTCAFSLRIAKITKSNRYGYMYHLVDGNVCYLQHICNFGDPVYDCK